ncbi:MAG: GNAT family N-acetyltransferase [Pseudomonadota bacterium]
MLEADYYIEPADWRYDEAELRPIRITVFVEEQQCPEDEEFDAIDPVSRHFLARDLTGTVIGTARLTPDGYIGRMAVAPAWRGRGVGAALLQAGIDLARAEGRPQVELSAQVHAIPFYERFGFVAEGDVYDEVGIPHRHMALALTALDVGPVGRERRAPADPSSVPAGRFSGAGEFTDRVIALIRCTARELAVFTHDLEPAALNREPVADALRDLLVTAEEPQVRVVIRDSRRAVEIGHRWLALGQRLSSGLQFRNPPREFDDRPGGFLVADGRHVLHRDSFDRWDGYVRMNDPSRARLLLEDFMTAWEHGTRDPRTVRLDL